MRSLLGSSSGIVTVGVIGVSAIAGALILLAILLRPKNGQPVIASFSPIALKIESHRDLEFGTTWAQPTFQWSIPFENCTAEGLDISGFDVSCECVRVVPERFVLKPGQDGSITLLLDLSQSGAEVGTDEVVPVSIEITPLAGRNPDRLETWIIRGAVRKPVHIAKANLDLGIIDAGAGPFVADILIEAAAEVSGLILNAHSETLAFQQPEQLSTAPVRSFLVPVSIEVPVLRAIGPCHAEFSVTPVDDAGTHLPAQTFILTFVFGHGVRLDPLAITAGFQKVGTITESVFRLESDLDVDLEVTSVQASDDFLEVRPIQPSAIGNGPTFLVRQRVRSRGLQQGTISIQVAPVDVAGDLLAVLQVSHVGYE